MECCCSSFKMEICLHRMSRFNALLSLKWRNIHKYNSVLTQTSLHTRYTWTMKRFLLQHTTFCTGQLVCRVQYSCQDSLFCSCVFLLKFGVYVFIYLFQYSKSSPVVVGSSGFLVCILGRWILLEATTRILAPCETVLATQSQNENPRFSSKTTRWNRFSWKFATRSVNRWHRTAAMKQAKPREQNRAEEERVGASEYSVLF